MTRPTPSKPPAGARDPAIPRTFTGRVLVEVLSRSAIVRQGVRAVLRDSHRVVVLDRSTRRREPLVVLLELSSDDSRERDLLEHLAGGGAPVVVIVGAGRPDQERRALAAGATACVSPEISGAELARVLESVVGGGSGVVGDEHDGDEDEDDHDGVGARLVERFPPVGLDIGLTTREQQVVQLVARGMSNQEIADALFLSVNSIKTYIRTSYRKIGAHSRTQAVLWVLQQRAKVTGGPQVLEQLV